MSTEQILLQRCSSKCELCSSDSNLAVYQVPPESDGSAEKCVMICSTCQGQIDQPDSIDANHWRCLNDSMWSQTPAVQVMAWRQLKQLSTVGEAWANDLLDMLYLEEDVKAWAEATASNDEDDHTTPR